MANEAEVAKVSIEVEAKAKTDDIDEMKKSLKGVLDVVTKLSDKVGKVPEKAKPKGKSTIEKIGEGAKKAAAPVGKLLKSIGRIAFYRAIRTILSGIVNSIKEGADALYQWSSANGTSFAAKLDKIASSFYYLKNAIGAFVANFLEKYADSFATFVDTIAAKVNEFSEALAVLTGQKQYYKANANVFKAYSDSLSSASDSAKELEKTLLGIDEINALNDNKQSTSALVSGEAFSLVDTPGTSALADAMREINLNVKEFAQNLGVAAANMATCVGYAKTSAYVLESTEEAANNMAGSFADMHDKQTKINLGLSTASITMKDQFRLATKSFTDFCDIVWDFLKGIPDIINSITNPIATFFENLWKKIFDNDLGRAALKMFGYDPDKIFGSSGTYTDLTGGTHGTLSSYQPSGNANNLYSGRGGSFSGQTQVSVVLSTSEISASLIKSAARTGQFSLLN